MQIFNNLFIDFSESLLFGSLNEEILWKWVRKSDLISAVWNKNKKALDLLIKK